MRAVDIVLSALALLCLAPALLLICLVVRLTSPGPALFRQVRVGRYGRPFGLLKYRTMEHGAVGPAVTERNDDRVTPVGRFLRRWKLDELPQLVNVLRGEMSLVGPRPEVPEYVAHYTDAQREALSVRPGLTGAATLAYRNEEALLAGREDVVAYYLAEVMPAKLAIELRYLRRRSIRTDLGLLVRTAWLVLSGR